MATTQGMDAAYIARLQALIAAAPGKITIGSGFRTNAQQAALYKAKPNLAAKPGTSKHEKGLAADLVFEGGQEGPVAKWAHANAARFGLAFPMAVRRPGKKYEPWHVEMGGMKFDPNAKLDPSQVVDVRGQQVSPGMLEWGLMPPDPSKGRADIGVQIGAMLAILDKPIDFAAAPKEVA